MIIIMVVITVIVFISSIIIIVYIMMIIIIIKHLCRLVRTKQAVPRWCFGVWQCTCNVTSFEQRGLSFWGMIFYHSSSLSNET